MTVPAPGRARQERIYRDGVVGTRPRVPTGPEELERRGRRAMSRRADAYITGGAGAETTLRANREAFARREIVPRILRDVGERDLSVELFGRRLPAPLLLAPIGALDLVRRGADTAVARAAAATGVPMVISNQAGAPMEELAAAGAPRWFQLYWSTSDELVDSFLARAEASGCEAVVVTLDTTMLGWRPRDLDLGHLPFARGIGIGQYTSDPVFRGLVDEALARPATGPSPRVTPQAVRTLLEITRNAPGGFLENLRSPVPRAAVETFLRVYSRPQLSWEDLAGLRARTRLPIVVKGVLHPDDARRAADAGADGVVVSNHGGRQLDHAVASLDALPGVAEAVGDRLAVLLDSGVRTGADVATAVRLGARAVLLGRPYAHGLALDGARGVAQVLQNVIAELDLVCGLAGARTPAGIELRERGSGTGA
ncbi:FMN-dependent dehydrogenase, includes L-lactate dehydrogenase and type II isopentenyl diphosphate isomerase [Pseudonocardia ammonioxydans]|uniref:FMN-dependent dehydrogenase, includes L-lactate dehydrogenase and type II isopentenyl diphosphate isomerase n=1 Tax=Pseudonocardia ammonioxydans TaxID=260086 RepID=A0A1I4XZ68_PSUAM|nr:alpha-hydroxy-acid oxidizing protein [Pseudonocardia ammonioxydans]SFN31087.1 FMN-dependent dehydrogenase, includes L-lactate dehydrogenase and type II isopentenyl diphosphate isomerase [Pseudonocardia ammonioxydans]